MEYKGYTARVEFDQEAGILHGEVEGLRDMITFEATDVRGLLAAFRASVDDYLAQCEEDSVEPEKPYSGRFLLRLDPRMHREIAMAAARGGRSLNAFAGEVFRNWIDAERGHSKGKNAPQRAPSANAAANPQLAVPPFTAPDVPSVVATPQVKLPTWLAVMRDTPGAITPSTPPVKTPSAKPRTSKVA